MLCNQIGFFYFYVSKIPLDICRKRGRKPNTSQDGGMGMLGNPKTQPLRVERVDSGHWPQPSGEKRNPRRKMGVLFLSPHNSTHCSKEISCNNIFDKPSTTIWHLKWGNTTAPLWCWCTRMGTTKHGWFSIEKSAFSCFQSIFRLKVFWLVDEICSKMGTVVILLNFPCISNVSIIRWKRLC